MPNLTLPRFDIVSIGIPSNRGLRCISKASREQNVLVSAAELELHFRKGETIHTENSYKFTDESLGALLSDSGFEIQHSLERCA